ncbi:2-amino-4-hydroxy-6-hydroxymethyldihydropteridine diphosphokinase [Paenibacillus albicereus]|uniref:2-amino-4-hydroxy-6-hydroxymethyldihydropteridine diphosphokinase n=1 Tax=Paenibacillus albicereus TaxID=2726185 RepID=A0A6H2GS58_9BACL|nr:2-amino-4-hydroxy-6-hydroxymethyldihydropteridine diphosphokinase [Paenibacillus albicereus]QJC50240.1 2-amino-4-hydroxy-6-hydroxymethyldihydropteridine diphosphokinase [Paenibacillus albicereus]
MDKSFPLSGPAAEASLATAHIAYIALGSNLGNRSGMLLRALRLLDASDGIDVADVSDAYETDPVGYADQPAFLNMAARLSTTLDPQALLRRMLELELALGRVREFRNGPRVIDLDLLLYADARIHTAELELPHPRMLERAFVMAPLAEVLERDHPLLERAEAMAEASLREGKEGIARWNTINWRSGSAPSES